MADVSAPDGVAKCNPLRQQALALWQAHENAHWLPIVGHSMLPLLREGDQVLVARRRTYAIGDLVLFLQGGELIVHRVVAYEPTPASTWIVQGDNCSVPDRPISAIQMLGKVIAIRHGQTIHAIDSWRWHWVNPLIARCAVSAACRPLQRLILRVCARYLRLVLKG